MFLETERLLLVPLKVDELEKALESKTKLAESLGFEILAGEPEEKMKAVYNEKISKIYNDIENWKFYTYWQIVLKDEKIIIGEIGFRGIPDESGEVEISFGTEEKFRNKGYATEALSELIKWAFEQNKPRVEKIKALTLNDNVPSHKVLEKAGLALVHEKGKTLYWNVSRITN